MLEDIDSLRVGRRAKEIAKGARHFDNNADRMRYAGFRAAAVPSGSGGLESAVRRVINHRMKGNSRFWLPERAEGMLHLRSHLKAGRWDEPCLSGCLTNPRSDLAGGRERAVRTRTSTAPATGTLWVTLVAAETQIPSGCRERCIAVPAVGETWYPQARHFNNLGRVEMRPASRCTSQRGQTNPAGQRRLSRYLAQAASSENRSWNSSRLVGLRPPRPCARL